MRRLALAALVATGLTLAAPQALAATPTSTRLTVPGDVGAHSGSWQGDQLSGQPDPAGPPATLCTPGQCDREQLNIEAEDPNYTTTHTLTCTLWITYGGTATHVFDLALLDGRYQLIKAVNHVGSGQPLVISGIAADHFIVEVDSDVAAQPTSYVGHVALSATPAGVDSTLPPPPHFAAAPPLAPPDPPPAALPRFTTVPPTIGPGIGEPAQRADPPPTFGGAPIAAAADRQHGGGVSPRFLVLLGMAALALTWLGRRFAQAWRRAGQPAGP